jgi:hypothetical protein
VFTVQLEWHGHTGVSGHTMQCSATANGTLVCGCVGVPYLTYDNTVLYIPLYFSLMWYVLHTTHN